MQTSDDAVAKLLAGALGVMPTDTLYGLVARAEDRRAMSRLYALKKREHKPVPVIAANVQQLAALGVPEKYLKKVTHLWPSPLSVVMPVGEQFAYLHQGLGDLPFRVVADEQLRRILEKTGPLAASSANLPGQHPAATVNEAFDYFGDAVDFYVDGGDLSGRASSTIVKASDTGIDLIREGAIKWRDIAAKSV